MSDPLAEDYLRWLEPQIRDEHGNPSRSYWDLLVTMFNTPYYWSIPNDDNRMDDGVALRAEFCFSHHIRPDGLAHLGQASFLEVLIGLSRRMSFQAGGGPNGWAWQLLNNLGLHRMADPLGRRRIRQVEVILDTVIWRTYEPNGNGGFFPLIGSEIDMTRIELWYQMAAYLDEVHPEHRHHA